MYTWWKDRMLQKGWQPPFVSHCYGILNGINLSLLLQSISLSDICIAIFYSFPSLLLKSLLIFSSFIQVICGHLCYPQMFKNRNSFCHHIFSNFIKSIFTEDTRKLNFNLSKSSNSRYVKYLPNCKH